MFHGIIRELLYNVNLLRAHVRATPFSHEAMHQMYLPCATYVLHDSGDAPLFV